MENVPEPIRMFIASSNRGDSTAVTDCFAPDALLDDWGRRFHGRDGVASWDKSHNTGVQAHLEIVDLASSDHGFEAMVKVRGNGFNGTGHMHFELQNGKIAKLIIK